MSVYHFILKGQTTSIPGLKKEEQAVNIFPNPSNGEFIIESLEGNLATQVTISNAMGIPIFQSDMAHTKMAIDISDEPGGVYFLTLTNASMRFSSPLMGRILAPTVVRQRRPRRFIKRPSN